MESLLYTKIRRKGPIPFGYDIDPDNSAYLLPDPTALDLLKDAVQYVEYRALTLRKAAEYLAYESDRPISHEGIRHIIAKQQHPIFDSGDLSSRHADSSTTEENQESTS